MNRWPRARSRCHLHDRLTRTQPLTLACTSASFGFPAGSGLSRAALRTCCFARGLAPSRVISLPSAAEAQPVGAWVGTRPGCPLGACPLSCTQSLVVPIHCRAGPCRVPGWAVADQRVRMLSRWSVAADGLPPWHQGLGPVADEMLW